MIHTMTDETYALNCALEAEQKEEQRHATMFGVAFLSRCYWMIGAVAAAKCLRLFQDWDRHCRQR